MNLNFAKLNKLIDTIGLDKTREFMSSEFTVRDLKNAGFDVGKENMETKVYGSSILGPKIGQGFYQNLNNNFTPVTMDLWFMRAWGRLTGTLSGAKPEALIAQKERFVSALQDSGMAVPARSNTMRKVAEGIVSQHEQNYRKFGAEYKSGARKKSELTYAAERYIGGLDDINESPTSGGQRQWMRDVVNRAREILKQDGHDITPADLQATWWYPEKELYHKLGGRDAEGVNVDYATAFADAARKKGVSDAAIQERLRSLDK